MSDKTYIGTGKEFEFANGGTKVTMMFFEDDLKLLNDNFNDGCVKIDISRRREPSEKGMTHYGILNTFVPTKRDTEQPADDKGTVSTEDDNAPF